MQALIKYVMKQEKKQLSCKKNLVKERLHKSVSEPSLMNFWLLILKVLILK